MNTATLWMILIGVFCFSCGVQLLARNRHPLQNGVREMLRGQGVLLAVAVSGLWTGVSLPLSPLAAAVAAVAGIPGVIAMLLIRLILSA